MPKGRVLDRTQGIEPPPARLELTAQLEYICSKLPFGVALRRQSTLNVFQTTHLGLETCQRHGLVLQEHLQPGLEINYGNR